MMTRTPISFTVRMAEFVTSESGTVAVTRVFFGGAVVALAITLTGMFVFGADAEPQVEIDPIAEAAEAFRLANGGHDRGTVLAEGPRDYYTPDEARARYNIFSDPAQTTDDEVRDAHRTWVRRMNDHAYSQPGRAADMVLILENALQARVLEAHARF